MNFQTIDEFEGALESGALSVRDLYAAWEQRMPVPELPAQSKARVDSRQIPWLQEDISVPLLFMKRALEKEEFLLACDAARETLRHWTDASGEGRGALVRVRMNYAIALTRLGSTGDARRELAQCASDDAQQELGPKLKSDILVQLGNILREESHHATSRAAKLKSAEESLQFYNRSLELEPNRLDALVLSAATSLILGEPGSKAWSEAHDKARRILAQTRELEETEDPGWRTTWARAAAQTVLGDVDAAAQSYGELQRVPEVTTEILAESRYRAQFLAEALGKPRDFFKPAFPPLQLVVFAGHLPDLPGSPVRFPFEMIEPTREKIRATLKEFDVRVALLSAAAGADLLFAEAMHERGGAVHLVLPWSAAEFCQASVRRYERAGADPFWEPLFEQALKQAATTRVIGQAYKPGSEVGWDYSMEVTAGLALHTARVRWLDLQPMVLWDGQPGWGAGGTASFVDFWRHRIRLKPVCIELRAKDAPDRGAAGSGRARRCEHSTMHQEVKSMLFADIVGYSKLTEHVIPEFVETFLGRVSQLAAKSKHAPRSVNTWGDAVYAIFDFAHDAGCFALELTQMIQEGRDDWLRQGLFWEEPASGNEGPVKHPLNIRIGLHTGPVFMHYDPVVRRLGFTGAHVNRAARIEPVARAGEVFASEEFAALAELGAEIRRQGGGTEGPEENAGFVCEYAGSMQLAKDYPGWHRLYRVSPTRVLGLEELARAVHGFYLIEAEARDETPATNSAMRPWEELTEDLRDANRAQVADIPNKLEILGYELAPGWGIHPRDLAITDAQIEALAIREHDRWMNERQRNGWTYAPQRDNTQKHHPLLVPWDQLSEPEKEKDRDAVRNLPRLIEKAGFRLRQTSVSPCAATMGS